MRLIDADKLDLHTMLRPYCSFDIACEITDVIDNASTVNPYEWISVEDRLPNNDDYVLCWYEYRIIGGTHDGEKSGMYGIGYYFKGWTIECEGRRNAIVRAWQKLPIPPRGKKYE